MGPNPDVTRLRWSILVVCALAAIWAVAVAATGGFVAHLGPVRFSSREWGPSAALAAACAVAFRLVSTRAERADMLAVLLAGRWRPSWANAAVVIAIVATSLMAAVWLHRLPFWLDEEMIALNLRDRPLGDLSGALWLGQTAPLGWLAVQRLLLRAFGTGELALRALPLMFGASTVAVAAWTGRRWMGAAGAATLVTLVGFGQWLTYHATELKPYSADACWGLLLPVLAVWALDASDSARRSRRVALWWLAAAIGLWFANGAMLVAPACAVVVFVVSWTRDGWKSAAWAAAAGIFWLASFGAHYELAVRHTLESAFMQKYWAFAMAPANADPVERLTWLFDQLAPLARKPAGSRLWLAFWPIAIAGFAMSTHRLLGVMCALVPASAFLFGVLRIVPLHERLSLWATPVLYVGVALFVDRTAPALVAALRRRDRAPLGLAAPLALVGLVVTGDVVLAGLRERLIALRSTDHHQLDDRAGVAWLSEQRRPGDVLITTRLALPAIWWYAGVPLTGPSAGSSHPDGAPILEVGYEVQPRSCSGDPLQDILAGHRRALVYLGFRFDDVPSSFDQLLLADLGRFGGILAMRSFGTAGRALIVERFGDPADAAGRGQPSAGPLAGCLTVKTAAGW